VEGCFSFGNGRQAIELLERVLTVFSKCALKLLDNQADFDSAIRRFDPSRPSHSQRTDFAKQIVLLEPELQAYLEIQFPPHLEILCWFRFGQGPTEDIVG
jgi:hypothetical protein